MATSTLPSSRDENLRVFLFIVSLIGLYMQIHLYAGGRVAFPFLLPNLIGMAVFILYVLKRQFMPAVTMMVFLGVFALSALMVAAVNGYFLNALGKYSQLLFSVFAGYGLCLLMMQIPRERLRKLLAWLAWGILLVAFAEGYLGFHEIMIEINTVLYSWRPAGFYQSTERDLALWGLVRPLVFSTEPSLVGIWGTVLMVGATILSRSTNLKSYLVLIAYLGLILFIARSTAAALIPMAYIGATMLNKRNYGYKLIILFLGLLGLLAIQALTPAQTLVEQYMQGTSFFARIPGPYLTMLETFERSPLFGLGLGNDRVLETTVFDIWAREGMLLRSSAYVDQAGLDGMLTNNFFMMLINLGVVGSIFFLFVVYRFVRQIGRFPAKMVLSTTFGSWMTMGGFVDMRTWFFLFFFIACAGTVKRSKANVATRKN